MSSEDDALAFAGCLRAGENERCGFWSWRLIGPAHQLQGHLVGFAAHDRNIHGGKEFRHAIVLVGEEPVDAAVFAGYEVVERIGDEIFDQAHG